MNESVKYPDDINSNLFDIQGNILKAYRHPHAAYSFWHFPDGSRGRRWLNRLLREVGVTTAEIWEKDPETGLTKKPPSTINCAFTFLGLLVLGVGAQRLALLPSAFREGMLARAHNLGDRDNNSPERWDTNLNDAVIHAMVLINAQSKSIREERVELLRQLANESGVEEIADVLEADALPEQREHFGFRDGIGQPNIEGGLVDEPGMGVPLAGDSWRPIKPGEFLLGYEAERGAVPLPIELVDLCMNGTFLVFRKLAQDVAAFQSFVSHAATQTFGSNNDLNRDRLAANLVGRWKSGAPLMLSPDHDPGEANNNFRYREDPQGLHCPLGAHIRRVNPRDALDGTDSHVPFHRILRRGLPYGPLYSEDPKADRGVAFFALNADIETQFEFIQEEWVQKGEFAGLPDGERDPIVGNNLDGPFTLLGATHSPIVFGLNQFVMTKGGGYFLMPGLTTIELLAANKL